MIGPVTASGRDLRALAGIIRADRGEPPAEGVAPSLLGDLLGLVRCDHVFFSGHDSNRQVGWFGQLAPADLSDGWYDPAAFWKHYWGSACSYPRPQRRPAQRHQDLGFLLGPAIPQHRRVQRLLPAVRDRA